MKLVSLLFLLQAQLVLSFNPEVLDYVLRSIEYLSSVHGGVFSCVFYDVTPRNPYDNILDAILRSPRLDHVAKYVLNGTFHTGLWQLPWNPSMLLMIPGSDLTYLERNETDWAVAAFLQMFNPSTKVWVLGDFLNGKLAKKIEEMVGFSSFCYSVFLDYDTMRVRHCNGAFCWSFPNVVDPIYLFDVGRRHMSRFKLTFLDEYYSTRYSWKLHWMNESARYLKTESVKLASNCSDDMDRDTLRKCFEDYSEAELNVDISLNLKIVHDIPRYSFNFLFTTVPSFNKILVPRNRPLNAAEIITMPFNLEVWIVISAILAVTEIANLIFPVLLKNDPVLLVVCGFEKYNLNRAGRWEKLILFSLIIMMFFLSNAFETKIISLMTSKPSIQRIKTLSDFLQSDLVFYRNLDLQPYFVNLTFGNKVRHHIKLDYFDQLPNEALVLDTFWASSIVKMVYDYERMQPFYDILDYEYFVAPEIYRMKYRSLFLNAFRYMHITLTEVGLIDFWKVQERDAIFYFYNGKRLRKDHHEKMDLNFDDMLLAWVLLSIGLTISLVGFLGEHLAKWFDYHRS